MQFKRLTCCAFEEINGVEEVNDSKESLLEICRHVWPERRVTYGDRVKPPAFFLLHGVVGVDEDSDEYCGYDDNELGAVERLATFIKKHDLGTIVAGPTRRNRVNEPSHKVRGYIWAASDKNLWTWFQENKIEADKLKFEKSLKEERSMSLY